MLAESGRDDAGDRRVDPRVPVRRRQFATNVEVVLIDVVVDAGQQLGHDHETALAQRGVLPLGQCARHRHHGAKQQTRRGCPMKKTAHAHPPERRNCCLP